MYGYVVIGDTGVDIATTYSDNDSIISISIIYSIKILPVLLVEG